MCIRDRITGKAQDVSDTTEDGAIEFMTKKAGANNIAARLTHANLDLINGTGLSVAGNATITGNLTVNGSTTTLNTATLDVEDKNITLNKGSGDTSGSADGAGITIQDAVDASTDATLTWNASTDSFNTSHSFNVIGNISLTNDLVYNANTNFDIKNPFASQNMTFHTTPAGGSATERMRIKHDGNVGIGTSSPATALHVNGEITIPASIVHEGDSDTFFGFHTNNQWRVVTNGTERIEVRDSEVVINDGSNSYDFRVESNNKQNMLLVDGSTDRVGIATSSPQDTLNIHDSAADANLGIKITRGSQTHGLRLGVNDSHAFLWTSENQNLVFATSGTQRMAVLSAGQIGINANSARTTGGTARLTIADSSVMMNMGPSNSDNMYIRRMGGGLFQFQTYNGGNSGHIELEPYGGKVGIGTAATAPVATFQVEQYGIDTTSTSSSATTQIAIHTFAKTAFRSARFTVQVTNSTDSTYHITELLLVHDGTTANITEFGEIHTGSAKEATFDADISGSNVRLLATPASTDSMAFKVVAHAITT